MSTVRGILTALLYLALAGVAGGIIALLVLIAVVIPDVPRIPPRLSDLISVPPTEVYAGDGSLITQVGGRSSIPIERVAEEFTLAILAVEDDGFWEHEGIDKPALARATLGALTGSSDRGGSTITQQLAKNLFFSFEKTWSRKFKEILATLEIERQFSKEEILEAYVNGIPFGPYSFGVEEAAVWYFAKHASELTLAEAALLAGLPQSPSRYNPYRNPELARERQEWVLARMLALGWIDQTEHDDALAAPLRYRPMYEQAAVGSYYLDAVLDELEQRYNETVLYHGGLKIYTTMDPTLQRHAVDAVRDGLAALDERMGLPRWEAASGDSLDRAQGALVAMDAATGSVLALVGGRDWSESQFNRVTQSTRNMGSVLKPVLYLTAIEQLGLHPGSMVTDSSITVEIAGARDWTPRNFNPYLFYGRMPLKLALMRSLNTVAAKLVLATGPEAMIASLHRFNVRSPQQPNLAIALGATSVNLIELAGIGAGIANLGATVDPFLIRRVEDLHGRLLEERIVRREQAFDPDDVYLVVDMMEGVVDGGTATAVRRAGLDLPLIGKTGTTNDFRDSWFLGATPRLACSAWVGFDDNRPMRASSGAGITGASGALPLWTEFMLRAIEGEPPREFRVPPGVHFETVHRTRGDLLPADVVGGLRVALPQDVVLPDYRILAMDTVRSRDEAKDVVRAWDELVGVPWEATPFFVPETTRVDTGGVEGLFPDTSSAPFDTTRLDTGGAISTERLPRSDMGEPENNSADGVQSERGRARR